jgi:hypothetical protein
LVGILGASFGFATFFSASELRTNTLTPIPTFGATAGAGVLAAGGGVLAEGAGNICVASSALTARHVQSTSTMRERRSARPSRMTSYE